MAKTEIFANAVHPFFLTVKSEAIKEDNFFCIKSCMNLQMNKRKINTLEGMGACDVVELKDDMIDIN